MLVGWHLSYAGDTAPFPSISRRGLTQERDCWRDGYENVDWQRAAWIAERKVAFKGGLYRVYE